MGWAKNLLKIGISENLEAVTVVGWNEAACLLMSSNEKEFLLQTMRKTIQT